MLYDSIKNKSHIEFFIKAEIIIKFYKELYKNYH